MKQSINKRLGLLEQCVPHCCRRLSLISVKSTLRAPGRSVSDFGELLGWWDAAGKVVTDPHSPIMRALQKGEASHSEGLTIHTDGGASQNVMASVAPLHSPEKEITGAVVLIQTFAGEIA